MTRQETTLVIHALLAVSPSGGGSATFTLARALMAEFDIQPDDETVGRMIETAHLEMVGD